MPGRPQGPAVNQHGGWPPGSLESSKWRPGSSTPELHMVLAPATAQPCQPVPGSALPPTFPVLLTLAAAQAHHPDCACLPGPTSRPSSHPSTSPVPVPHPHHPHRYMVRIPPPHPAQANGTVGQITSTRSPPFLAEGPRTEIASPHPDHRKFKLDRTTATSRVFRIARVLRGAVPSAGSTL